MTEPKVGFDVDEDHVADVLAELAEGIRADDIPVTKVVGKHVAEADDTSTFKLSLTYLVMEEYEQTTEPIHYIDRNVDD